MSHLWNELTRQQNISKEYVVLLHRPHMARLLCKDMQGAEIVRWVVESEVLVQRRDCFQIILFEIKVAHV